MFSWFRKKASSPVSPPLVFRDNEAALAYANEYLDSTLTHGAVLPALVLEINTLFGSASTASTVQVALIRINSKDGGFVHAALTASSSGPRLKLGDLVAWNAIEYKAQLLRSGDDRRTHWNGLIVAKLHPEYSLGRGWAIEYAYVQT